MKAKNMLVAAAGALGAEIRKFPRTQFDPMPVFHLAVQLLDERLQGRVSFVQIGANDGLFVDPLRRYIIGRPWEGLLVEPQRDVFTQLKTNYRDARDRLKFENVAIGADGSTLVLYTAPNGSGQVDQYASSVVSADRKIVARQLGMKESELQQIRVPCVTLNALLERNSIKRVDLLQIDAEGYDWSVLQTLDFARHRPTIVQFESGHLTRADCDAVAAHFAAHQYYLYWGGRQGDAVAISKDFLDSTA